MAKVIKTIRGRKYEYRVTWDKENKKRVWKYVGVVKGLDDGDGKVGDLDKLYNLLKRDPLLRLSNKQLKRVRHHIKKIS